MHYGRSALTLNRSLAGRLHHAGYPRAAVAPSLPIAVQEAVKLQAIEWGSTASILGLAAGTQIAWLASDEAIEDEARLIEVCDNLADASGELVQDFHRRAVSAAGMAKGIDKADVERFFRETLRGILPRASESESEQDGGYFQLPIVPFHSFILSAPALAPPNPVLERILERLLQVLTRLLQVLPPGSPAAAAVQRAIDAIMALLGTTDTTAPVVQNGWLRRGCADADARAR